MVFSFQRTKSLVQEAGVQPHPKSFDLVKIRAKSVKTFTKLLCVV